ncbi:MAG TPA: acyclic terpene utilization AtuA family protein [Acidimicrobiales bacterium]|nr:acyclic terpene utilization AtuA family protein [Acidimicrobiales bacterium]
MSNTIRIANCSGFYGDRLSAAREMVEGGPIDVLTGDWLAELTMLILAKNLIRDPAGGYARTFLSQMEQVMGECLDRRIRVVSNAGGLSPRGCADALAAIAEKLGLDPLIAYVEGDNLIPRMAELRSAGVRFTHMDTGEPLDDRPVMTANAYVGGWGIAEALSRGADIVVTGRVTDAALAVGPAAWHHGWKRDDWNALAGAVVAGHVIECGAQATGGNYAFFTEIPGLEHPGFPIAEIDADGSSVITKHPGHGGRVSVGTVTAQLLYEITGPAYINPDVTARFDSIRLAEETTDRVRISGVEGEPPPTTAKVALNYQGGWRSTTVLYLTGLDIEEKASLVERALWAEVPKDSFETVDVQLLRTDKADPASNEEATAELRITVKDDDERKVGRAFSSKVTELALASYPGLFGGGLTAGAQAYGVYWPALVPADLIYQEVVVGQERSIVEPVLPPDGGWPRRAPRAEASAEPTAQSGGGQRPTRPERPERPASLVRAPLGRVIGARSGDKGGNANLGVWARSRAAYQWVDEFLTVERLKALLPETGPLTVHRYPLPNILAVNFVVEGLLGEGVASSTRLDAQAKSLGEWLRARYADIPEALLP